MNTLVVIIPCQVVLDQPDELQMLALFNRSISTFFHQLSETLISAAILAQPTD